MSARKAVVFVKHQGIIDDPNSHLENKIRRLVSGSINGLDINDVTIVSDRSRFTDISVDEPVHGKSYVRIWSMIISQDSAATFRFLFFTLLTIALLFAALAGWLIWKVYPLLRSKDGWKQLVKPSPLPLENDHD